MTASKSVLGKDCGVYKMPETGEIKAKAPRGRGITAALLSLGGLVLLGWVFPMVAGWFIDFSGLMARMEKEVQAATGLTLHVQKVRLGVLGTFSLEEIKVLSGSRKVMEIPRVMVGYNPLMLITHPDQPLSVLRSVEIFRPVAQIDEKTIGDLTRTVKNPKSRSRPVWGLWVNIAGGEINWHGSEGLPAVSVERISGRIYVGTEKTDVSWLNMFLAGAEWTVSGKVNYAAHPFYSLQVKGAGADLSRIRAFLTPWRQYLPALTGKANLNLVVSGDTVHPVLQGRILLRDVSGVRAAGITPDRIDGTLNLKGQTVSAEDLRVRIQGADFHIQGKMVNFTQPRLGLSVTFNQLGVDDLQRWLEKNRRFSRAYWDGFSVDGKLGGQIDVKGGFTDLVLEGKVTWTGRKLAGLEARRLEASFAYSEKKLVLTHLDGSMVGGRVSGEGLVELASGGWAGTAHLQGINASQLAGWLEEKTQSLPGYWDLLQKGRLSGDLNLEATGGLENLKGGGEFSLDGAYIQGLPASARVAGFYHQGTLTLTEATVQSGAGTVRADGSITSRGDSFLRVEVSDLKPSAFDKPGIPETIRKLASNYGLGGKVSFRGLVEGNLKDPQVRGELTWDQAAVLQRNFDLVYGDLRYADGEISTRKLTIMQGNTRHQMAGRVALSNDHGMHIVWTAEDARLEDFLRLLGQKWEGRGTVDGLVTVDGTFQNPSYQGKMTFGEGTILNQPFKQGTLIFNGRGGNFNLETFTVKAEAGEFSGSGSVQGEKLDLAVEGKGIDLSRFQQLKQSFGSLKGTVGLKGRVGGTVAHPEFRGQMEAGPLSMGAYRLDTVRGEVNYSDNRLYLNPLVMTQLKTEYRITGEILLQKVPTFNLTGNVSRGDLGRLAGLLKITLPPGVGGTLSGTVGLSGTSKQPVVNLDGLLEEGHLAELPITGTVKAKWANGELTLDDLRLQGGEGRLVGMGRLSADQSVTALFGVEKFSLLPLLKIGWPTADITGEASGRVRLTGKVNDPHVEMAVLLEKGMVGEVSYDKLEGSVVYGRGQLQVSELQLSKGAETITADGQISLPADLLKSAKLKTDGSAGSTRMDLTVQFPEGQADILNLIWGHPYIQKGRTGFKIHLTGTPQQPSLEGKAELKDITFNNGFIVLEALDGQANFQGKSVEFDKVKGRLWGGSLSGGGQVIIDGVKPSVFNLWAKVNDAYYQTPFLTGHVAADVTLKGVGKDLPTLAGKLQLNRSTLSLGSSVRRGKFPLNMALNLDLTSADDVRVTTPGESLNVWAYGRLNIGGTLNQVTLSGRAEAARGEIDYFGTTFRITQGVANFGSYQGVIPNLDVTAETRTQEALVTLHLSGPATAMNLQITSDPPMSTEEILGQITLPARIQRLLVQKDQAALKAELVRFFDDEVTNQVFGGLEHVIRDALQLDEFRIERGFAEENLQLRFGKYLVRNLYVTYTRTIEYDPQENLRFEYRFLPGFLFQTGFDSKGVTETGLELKIRF